MMLSVLLLAGCSQPGGTGPTGSQDTTSWTPGTLAFEGTMSFKLNNVQHNISVFAQSSGYAKGEVVIRGSGLGMENTLMLTFKPRLDSLARINREMTGYWDLGLCIPFNKYLLSADADNFIRISSNDSTLVGDFTLIFRYQSDSTRTAIFTHGTFTTKVDTLSPFTYCIEG